MTQVQAILLKPGLWEQCSPSSPISPHPSSGYSHDSSQREAAKIKNMIIAALFMKWLPDWVQ
jgi:hypothetical protein